MRILFLFIFTALSFLSCNNKIDFIKPVKRDLTESVYASGNIESDNQYQVYSTINGIIKDILVEEGQSIKTGTPIFTISSTSKNTQIENALLTKDNASLKNNKSKIESLKLNLNTAKLKWRNDSLLLIKKARLYKKDVITEIEFEAAELNYQNSFSNYKSTTYQLEDLIKQLKFNDKISTNNSKQTIALNDENIIKSEIKGVIFSILKKKGEFITPQIPLAILGSNNDFVLKLQIDEYDIIKIRKGQKVFISLDSYKNQTFTATITKIYPIMNERSKTFTVDAKFNNAPQIIYPNLSIDANIEVNRTKNCMTIPRKYLSKSNSVKLKSGEFVKVETGLKNYDYVQIVKGLSEKDEIVLPNEN